MKKLSIFIIAIAICMQNSFANAIENVAEQRGFISVSSEKTKEVSPNVAQITITKETTAKTPEAASNENKLAIDKINKSLQTFVQNGSTTLQTGSYSVYPNYSYKGDKRQVTGYTVVNSIIVKTKSIDNLGKIIDFALQSGADRVDSLNFLYEDNSVVCKDLIQSVSKEALDFAKITAASLGQSLKGIKSINTACYTENSGNFRNFAMAKSFAGSDEAQNLDTSINSKQIKIRASVNADFYVK